MVVDAESPTSAGVILTKGGIVVCSTKSKLLSNKPRQVRDPEATKVQILDAAESEFAKHGLSGAWTEAIASRSGVTKAMIYYYLESKEGLY